VKVLDLYAGVGGWAVGFELAGFTLSESYEWWEPAADTHRNNSPSPVRIVDIRTLELSELPKDIDIDIVIGSPPCTQFSYSNRGGSGDISDGLVDIAKFLDVVRFVKPKFWAFENVPRVKKVLEAELRPDGQLKNYRDLFADAQIEVFDMANFGVPQRRKRCIAGNFNFELLRSYSNVSKKPTLGDVIFSLKKGQDPIYSNNDEIGILDNEPEVPLNWEEERFNREMKVSHPIYNGMPFPDPLDRTSRTVTATCTRVSRESLVVFDEEMQKFRRLSVRERASLQSFPISFQFLGKSHSEKLKMIGNAIPPAFTYLIAEAIKGVSPKELVAPSQLVANMNEVGKEFAATTPDNAGKTYPSNRRFRFSIPHLRFKSGTRFELSNVDGPRDWKISFYFGDSKRIHRKDFRFEDVNNLSSQFDEAGDDWLPSIQKLIEKEVMLVGSDQLQSVWTHRAEGIHPFEWVDQIARAAEITISKDELASLDEEQIVGCVFTWLYGDSESRVGQQKIQKYAREIFVGAIISASVNGMLSEAHFQALAS